MKIPRYSKTISKLKDIWSPFKFQDISEHFRTPRVDMDVVWRLAITTQDERDKDDDSDHTCSFYGYGHQEHSYM